MFESIFHTNWIEIIDVLIRGFFSLVVLFLITKLLGKKQVSQLSLFDYVIGISIGNFAAEVSINTDVQMMNGIIAVLLFGLIAYLVSILTMKSIVLRRFFMGTPTILVQHGKLLEQGLKRVNFDVNDLLEECRSQGYFDMSQIEYAIMESNGKVSFLPKGEYRPLTIRDMNLKVEKQTLCANVIIDGNLMLDSLKNMGKKEKWLRQELKVKGYDNYKDILLATLDGNDKIYVYNRNRQEQIKNVLE